MKNRKDNNPTSKPKKLFVLATEESVSERNYLNYFIAHGAKITFLGKKNHSSPCNILNALETYLSQEPLDPDDEAWAVIDKDSWTKEQIDALLEWEKKDERYHVAITDPKFEYFWILHHDEADNLRTSADCDRKLDSLKLPRKKIDVKNINTKNIKLAISRSVRRYKEKLQPDKPDIAFTNMHQLIESIISYLISTGEYPVND